MNNTQPDRERELKLERDRYQEAADRMAAEHKVERDALAAENERLLAANRDCIDWFDALKADYDKLREAAKLGLEKAYLAGFMSSGEGYNGEYPFQDKNKSPVDDPSWLRDRNNAITALKEALGEQA